VNETDALFYFPSPGPEETLSAGRALADAIPDTGMVIRLSGPLGAGKTVFVKGLAQGLGLDPRIVSSPTFTLVNEYDLGPARRLAHADLYRVESEIALEEVGFFDLMEAGTVLVAEWGDRYPRAFPSDRLEIEIVRKGVAAADANARELRVRATGDRSRSVLREWRQSLSA
jgi:tRNA threonylcarbamoyladenosine biosynthesis protein TsaE